MFDVVWTDHNRELVGEHRAKKEMAKEQKSRERGSPSRSSTSTRASSSSSDRAFGFFGAKSLIRGRSKKTSNPSSDLVTPTLESRSGRGSISGISSMILKSTEFQNEPFSQNSDAISLPGPESFLEKGEALSLWSRASIESTKSSFIQTLGPSSFITRCTEIIITPRTPETDKFHHLVSEISIGDDRGKCQPPTPPISPIGADPFLASTCQVAPSPGRLDSPVNLAPGSNGAAPPAPPGWASAFKPNNPDAWKPPDAWDYAPPTEVQASIDEKKKIAPEKKEEENFDSVGLDLQRMEREVKRMAAASPAAILQRLRETWGSSQDADLYKEQETEKKRWMLSALQNMDPVVDKDTSVPSPTNISPQNAQKILALHENKATASYLAALYSTKQVYHVSSAPLSHQQFPNIHPLQVPGVSAAPLSVAPEMFGAAYSLSLPSLVASQDIPQVLRNVHRCLAPGGVFYLTVIDPMPVASSLGPHMRKWLEDNLLLNLERHFRCQNPSRLFPIWLADGSLRAEGSTITTAKFLAVTDLDDAELKTELRSCVGRMLWTEVWGNYVAAETWWWEEPECVRECLELRTHWEYNLIEAVKDP